ncbi:MAG TPA: hypothetical protein VL017_09770 [Devosia sp.]|nr:hypothetical protein [Sphingomonadaceae bacterium]HTO28865.1 hypothetical protein [Devosia sp.]
MDTVLSILVLAAVALLGGAFVLWRRGGSPKQIVLMVVLAMVMAVNVMIWTVPDESGEAPVEKAAALAE